MSSSINGGGGADVPAGRKKREPDRVKRFDSADLAYSRGAAAIANYNGSGFYDHDVAKIVRAVTEYAENSFAK